MFQTPSGQGARAGVSSASSLPSAVSDPLLGSLLLWRERFGLGSRSGFCILMGLHAFCVFMQENVGQIANNVYPGSQVED